MAKLSNVKTLDMVNGEVTKIEHNGSTYVKTDDKVKAGDIFKLLPGHVVIEGDDNAYYTTHGARGSNVLIDTKYFGSATHVQKVGHGVAFRKTNEATVGERISSLEVRASNLEAKKQAQPETITHEGVEYKRVDREAREGDVVVFDLAPDSYSTEGKPYPIERLDVVTMPIYLDNDGDEGVIEDFDDVKVYEPIVDKPAPLQVGDYAKVVIGSFTTNGFDVGDIVELETNYVGKSDFKISSIDGESSGFANRHMLVRATDEEVAEAKRQQAEKAVADKWAEIGRKPNEFKVGDAVQYKKAFTTVSYVGRKYIRIRQSSNVEHNIAVNPANLTLVFPVESKFGGDSE